MTTKEISPELSLPENDRAKTLIQNKLTERKGEIERYHREHPAQHPDFRERMLARQICEVRILEQLFSSNKAIAWDLSKEIMEKHREKDPGSMQSFAIGWLDAWDAIVSLLAN
ncbi:MAG: hypothetical protein WC514_02580 [Candidatus Paceibacterota bacterium]